MIHRPDAGNGPRVLVVDDDAAIRGVLRRNLEARGYRVETADGVATALVRVAEGRPDAIVLDLGLPDGDGIDVIRTVRDWGTTPIVVLSARETERDKVAALDAGADDYVSKPFGVEELLARLRVALRHTAGSTAGPGRTFQAGDLEVDREARVVRLRGEPVHLTPTEYDLLSTFVAHPGRVLTTRRLLQAAWGPDYGSEQHYVHVYMARLRKKLEPDPARPPLFQTEPGVGYRLLSDE